MGGALGAPRPLILDPLPSPAASAVAPSPVATATAPLIVRSRPVRVDAAALPTPGSEPGTQSLVNLFPDLALTVAWDKLDRHGARNYCWHGRTLDDALGAATLTVVGDSMILEVNSPAQGRFEVLSRSDGTSEVRQFDPEKLKGNGACVVSNEVEASANAPAAATGVGTDATAPPEALVTAVTIDVLMVYTAKARDKAGGRSDIVAKAQAAVNAENGNFSRSDIAHRMRLVQAREVGHTASGNLATELGWVAGNDTVADVRSDTGADIVALISDRDDAGMLGIAMQLTSTSGNSGQAFSANYYDTVSGVWPHEVGHNLGCAHNSAGVYSYSSGHYWKNANGTTYGSLMSYIGTRVPHFSNPDVKHWTGTTGTSTRDNARSIDNIGDNVAGYKSSKTLIEPSCEIATSSTNPREGVDFTLTVTTVNGGPSTATACKITVSLPSQLTLVSHNGGSAFSTSTKVWDVPDYSDGVKKTLVLTVRAKSGSAGDSLSPSAKVTSAGTGFVDFDVYNNEDSVTVVPKSATTTETYWNGGAASWNTSGNWHNGLPGSAVAAYIGEGGTCTYNAGTLMVSGLKVGVDSGDPNYPADLNGDGVLNFGSGTLTVNDDITINRSGNTGRINLSGGTIKCNGILAQGSSGGSRILMSGGTLNLSGGTIATTLDAFNFDGGTLTDCASVGCAFDVSPGTPTLNAATKACTCNAAITAGNLYKSGAQSLTLGGTTDNSSLILYVNANAGSVILNKASSATVHAVTGIGKLDAGSTVTLSGSGGDQIYDGASGTVSLTGGTLNMNGQTETVKTVALTTDDSTISGAGALTLSNGGGAGIQYTGTSGIGTVNCDVVLGSGSGLDGLNNGAASGGTLAIGGVISGDQTLEIYYNGASPTGVVELRGANSYTGTTVLSDNILRLVNGDDRIKSGNDIVVNLNGRLDLNGQAQTFDSVTGSGAILVGGGALTIGSGDSSSAFGGTLSGAGSLTKTGAGTLTLSGTNTFSGVTTVEAGTLLVNGSHTGGGAYTVTGGTLGGTGSITGALAVEAGGTVAPGAPGASAGRLTVGATILRGTLALDIGGTLPGAGYDQLAVSGTISIDGASLDVKLLNGYVPPDDVPFVVLANDGVEPIDGTFGGVPEGGVVRVEDILLRITYRGGDGNDVALQMNKPLPGTVLIVR